MVAKNVRSRMVKVLLFSFMFSIFSQNNAFTIFDFSFGQKKASRLSIFRNTCSFIKKHPFVGAIAGGAFAFGLFGACAFVANNANQIGNFAQRLFARFGFAFGGKVGDVAPGIRRFDNAPGFDEWRQACEALPLYQNIARGDEYTYSTLTRVEFERAIAQLRRVLRQSSFANRGNWLGLDALAGGGGRSFVQKITTNDGARIPVHADVHGDIHSVVKYLYEFFQQGLIDDNFTITDPNFYIAFLGDYSDRGQYGAEVIYTAARLKAANPENVILLKGNHEDLELNRIYGFYEELRTKFQYGEEDFVRIMRQCYDLLPVAVYICPDSGAIYKDYALLCHGGLEPRFNPHALLSDERPLLYQCIDNLDEAWLYDDLRKLMRQGGIRFDGFGLGFLWNDFTLAQDRLYLNPGRGNVFGQNFTRLFLEACSSEEHYYRVKCIFRGHQHNGDKLQNMVRYHGIFNFWSEDQWSGIPGDVIALINASPVWILNVSPCSVYGVQEGYNYDTYAILTMRGAYDNWTLEPHNVIVF